MIGEPEINILSADVFEDNGRIRVTIEGEKLGLYIDKDVGAVIKDKGYKKVDLGVRGNDLAFSLKSEADDCIKANVHSFEPIGNKTILIANTVGQQLKAVVPNNLRLEIDEEIYMKINLKNAIYFDAENGRFIGRHNGNALASGERNNAKADS